MTVYYLRECGLLFGIFILVSKSILEDYRKKSSFFSDPAYHKAILTLSPTTLQIWYFPVNDDYRKKSCITIQYTKIRCRYYFKIITFCFLKNPHR